MGDRLEVPARRRCKMKPGDRSGAGCPVAARLIPDYSRRLDALRSGESTGRSDAVRCDRRKRAFMNAKTNIILRSMAFLAIVLSFAGRLVADEIEEEAENTVSFLKGVLVRDEKTAGRPITRIDLSGTAVNGAALRTVSYTHLTLPTKRIV